LHCHFSPLGIPVLLTADDPALPAMVEAAYADGKSPEPPEKPRITLRIERGEAPSTGISLDIRVTGSRLRLSGAGMRAEADATTMQGHCVLPVGDAVPSALMLEAIDAVLLFLLTRSGRTPLHAAGILLGDMALVLSGPSGSGKSTLTLAAARRGLQLLSDDMVFVQTEPDLRLWGLPRPLHVFPEDAPPGPHPKRLRAGKWKVAIPAPRVAMVRSTRKGRLILLRPGSELALDPVDPEQAVSNLKLEPGFDLLADESRAAVATLAAGGVWRLSLSSDPAAAIDLLCRHFNPLRAAG